VRPAVVDLHKVGVHYAVSSVFEGSRQGRIHSYSVDPGDYRLMTAGKARLALGRAQITSEVTGENAEVTFGVAHMGDHNVSGGIREYRGEEHYENTVQAVMDVFRRGDFAELVRVVDREFGRGTYSLKLLFRDEQRRILQQILESSLADAERAFRHVYEDRVSLMRFLTETGIPAPKPLLVAAEVTLNTDLRRWFERDDMNLERIRALVEETLTAGVPFDAATLEFALRKTLERMAERLTADPSDFDLLVRLADVVGMARSLPIEVVLWRVQNMFHNLMRTVYPAMREAGEDAWVASFRMLGDQLRVRVD
jgi:hypothetical protein